jgi:hypothetical protein
MVRAVLLRCLAAGLFAGSAGAQEKTAIDAAKRDLEVLKSTPAGTGDLKLALPEIGGPNLPSGSPPAPTGLDARKRDVQAAQAVAKKSQNWLLDAMAKEDSRQRALDGKTTAGDADEQTDELSPETLLDPDAPRVRTARDEEQAAAAQARAELRERPVVDNPLTAFMAGWISPRDQALLLPKASDTPQLDTALAPLLGPVVVEAPVVATAGESSLFVLDNTRASAVEANPYLQLSVADTPNFSRDPALPVTPPATPNPVPMPESRVPGLEPVRGELRPALPPDLAKPVRDEKYFPQLKRF